MGSREFGIECTHDYSGRRMTTYLGIDAGGSGSRWALLRDDAWVASGADGPPIQVAELGIETAAERVVSLLRGVSTPDGAAITTVAVGLAGVGDPDRRAALQDRLAAFDPRITVMEDTISGAASALAQECGVALFAGTGSFAVARGPTGTLYRTGGRGCVVSDHGSGYWLVRRAVEVGLQAADGIAPINTLGARLTDSFGRSAVWDLGSAMRDESARTIAHHSFVVLHAAAEGDAAATAILDEGADHLARLAHGAARKAGLDAATAPVFLGGGVLHDPDYGLRVRQALARLGGRGAVEPIPLRPEQGAALVARAMARGDAPLAGWSRGTRA